MATDPIPAPPGEPEPAKPAPVQGDGLSAWFHKNETTVLLGVAGIVVAIALYVRSRSSSANAAASSSGSSSPTPISYPEGVADTSGTDYGTYASDVTEQLGTIESQIAGLTPASAPATSSTAAATSAAANPSYTQVASATGVQDLISSGEGAFFEPASTPGQYLPVTQPGGQGGEWFIGSQPLAPGAANPGGSNPGTFFEMTPEPAASQ